MSRPNCDNRHQFREIAKLGIQVCAVCFLRMGIVSFEERKDLMELSNLGVLVFAAVGGLGGMFLGRWTLRMRRENNRRWKWVSTALPVVSLALLILYLGSLA